MADARAGWDHDLITGGTERGARCRRSVTSNVRRGSETRVAERTYQDAHVSAPRDRSSSAPLYEWPEFHSRTGEQTSVERRRTRTPYRARTPASVSSWTSPFPLDAATTERARVGVSVLYEGYINRMMLRPGAVAYRT